MVRVADTALFVDEVGEATPVIALHGGLGLDHTYLRPWLDDLARVARVVYVDHRGNGRSPAGRPLSQVGMTTWADDVVELADALGIARVVLLGHSFGGFIALEAALRHPDRVAGLVLVGTGAAFDHGDEIRANLDRLGATTAQRQAFTGSDMETDDAFAAWFRAAAPLYFKGGAAAVPNPFGDIVFRIDALAAGSACLAGWDRRGGLGDVRCPALVTTGRHDFVMPFETVSAPLAASLPNATAVVFEGSGHLPFVEEHDAFIRVVSTWLATLEDDR